LFACFKKLIERKKEEANLPFQPSTAARNRLCPNPVLRRGPFLSSPPAAPQVSPAGRFASLPLPRPSRLTVQPGPARARPRQWLTGGPRPSSPTSRRRPSRTRVRLGVRVAPPPLPVGPLPGAFPGLFKALPYPTRRFTPAPATLAAELATPPRQTLAAPSAARSRPVRRRFAVGKVAGSTARSKGLVRDFCSRPGAPRRRLGLAGAPPPRLLVGRCVAPPSPPLKATVVLAVRLSSLWCWPRHDWSSSTRFRRRTGKPPHCAAALAPPPAASPCRWPRVRDRCRRILDPRPGSV
jgi:hypothetical protein